MKLIGNLLMTVCLLTGLLGCRRANQDAGVEPEGGVKRLLCLLESALGLGDRTEQVGPAKIPIRQTGSVAQACGGGLGEVVGEIQSAELAVGVAQLRGCAAGPPQAADLVEGRPELLPDLRLHAFETRIGNPLRFPAHRGRIGPARSDEQQAGENEESPGVAQRPEAHGWPPGVWPSPWRRVF